MTADFSSPSLRRINVVTVWPVELNREMPSVLAFELLGARDFGLDV
jgi:hypothetical protein